MEIIYDNDCIEAQQPSHVLTHNTINLVFTYRRAES